MTSVFDYINSANTSTDSFVYYTVNEINEKVDVINEREREVRERQLHFIISAVNDSYMTLCNVFEKQIIPTLNDSRVYNQTEYINYIRSLTPNQLIDFGIKDELQRYEDLKLLYKRFKANPLKLPHVSAEEVNVYNVRNFINWQLEVERRREQQISSIAAQNQFGHQRDVVFKSKSLDSIHSC